MNRYLGTAVLLLTLSFGALAVTGMAQETPFTCDEGANDVLAAAQRAYDAGELENALDLRVQARNVCAGNTQRLREVVRLTQRVRAAIEISQIQPGMVNVGDHSLFMECTGEGSPTVVFENGWGQPRETWRGIPEAVARVTRVCTYDRRGHGRSDPAPLNTLITVQDQVDELMDLLAAAQIDGPYILVGHCGAGMNVRLFAAKYPELTAGLVMVDAFVPGLFTDFGQELLNDTRQLGRGSEKLDLDTSLQQLSTVQERVDAPLAVLTAYSWTPIPRDEWIARQAAYAARTRTSRNYVAVHSGHYIMDTEPDLIVDAILWIIQSQPSD